MSVERENLPKNDIDNIIGKLHKADKKYGVGSIGYNKYGVVVRNAKGKGADLGEVRYEFYRLEDKLGAGAAGSVYKADFYVKIDKNGKPYAYLDGTKAIKVLGKKYTKKMKDGIKTETNILNKLFNGKSHFTKINNRNKIGSAITMKYIKGQSMFDFINDNEFLNYPTRLKIARNVVKAVNKFHEMGYVHHDLKLENLMIDPETFEVTIIDFGLSAKIGDTVNPNGTHQFYGPEKANAKLQNSTVNSDLRHDNFSMAGILAEIFNSLKVREEEHSDEGYHMDDIFQKVDIPLNEKSSLLSHIKALGNPDFDKREKSLDLVSDYLDNLLIKHESKSKKELAKDIKLLLNNIRVNTVRAKVRKNITKFSSNINSTIGTLSNKYHGNKEKHTTEIANQLIAAKNALDEDNYDTAFDKWQEACDLIDTHIDELSQFRTYSPKAILAKVITPLSWVVGKISSKVTGNKDIEKYGLIKTSSAKAALQFKNEFKTMLYESTYSNKHGHSASSLVSVSMFNNNSSISPNVAIQLDDKPYDDDLLNSMDFS